MPHPVISKTPTPDHPPNLMDYEATCAAFSWEEVAKGLDGLPGGGLNIAHEAVVRHAAGPRGDQVAVRWRSRKEAIDLTWRDLDALSNRFANVLAGLGVAKGERVFALSGRTPELYAGALGTLKHRAVFCPLFSAFGPEPIASRVSRGDGTVLITTETLYTRKIAPIRDQLPLKHVLVVGKKGRPVDLPGCVDLLAAMADASPDYTIGPTDPEDMALLHFTSGTTGKPKGAVHVHQAVLMHLVTGRYALDLSADSVFWCTADPGWVTGTSYGIIAPLVLGATMVIDAEEFDAERWYGLLQDEGVTHWYTAPTAIRMLMKLGTEVAQRFDLSALRFVASVGEPLDPEGVLWGVEALGHPIHDNWWQTETGGIAMANYRSMPIRPGSMGRPLPGLKAAVVSHDADGVVEVPVGEEGELALRVGWPSMFRDYLHMPERYASCFQDGWYLSGDLVRQDADGYFWFVGRADDVIKSAGHLVGPFEVESALVEHEAVIEAAVIGKPDPIAGAIVKAFVVLATGFELTPELERAIMAHARSRLGPAVAPREIAFVDHLPHTRSGKIMRRLLKARELGLDEGDTSTLEQP